MHHHIFGLGTLMLVGGLIAGPHIVSAVHDMTASPESSRAEQQALTSSAQSMLASTIDATMAAGRTGRIDETLNAFSSSLEEHAHIPDRDVQAIMDAARGPESRQFLRSLGAAVRHPDDVQLPKDGLDRHDADLIGRVARELRDSLSNR